MIPQERVSALIGQGGATKKMLEERCGVKLRVSPEGEVEIKGSDAVAEWKTRDVVKAVGRGFSPHDAIKLLEEGYYLRIIDLDEVLGSRRRIERQKARVIGKKGKARMFIEEMSGAKVCVYGDTVSIIGQLDEVSLAEEAIMRLISGAEHSTIFNMLERARRKMQE